MDVNLNLNATQSVSLKSSEKSSGSQSELDFSFQLDEAVNNLNSEELSLDNGKELPLNDIETAILPNEEVASTHVETDPVLQLDFSQHLQDQKYVSVAQGDDSEDDEPEANPWLSIALPVEPIEENRTLRTTDFQDTASNQPDLSPNLNIQSKDNTEMTTRQIQNLDNLNEFKNNLSEIESENIKNAMYKFQVATNHEKVVLDDNIESNLKQPISNISPIKEELLEQNIKTVGTQFQLDNSFEEVDEIYIDEIGDLSIDEAIKPQQSLMASRAENENNLAQKAVHHDHLKLKEFNMVPDKMADAFTSKIEMYMKHNINHAKIALDPAELGYLEVRISQTGDRTHVLFNASTQTAKELLEGSIDKLRDDFVGSGLNNGEFEVSLSYQQGDNSHQNPYSGFKQRNFSATTAEISSIDTDEQSSIAENSSGLDVFI